MSTARKKEEMSFHEFPYTQKKRASATSASALKDQRPAILSRSHQGFGCNGLTCRGLAPQRRFASNSLGTHFCFRSKTRCPSDSFFARSVDKQKMKEVQTRAAEASYTRKSRCRLHCVAFFLCVCLSLHEKIGFLLPAVLLFSPRSPRELPDNARKRSREGRPAK